MWWYCRYQDLLLGLVVCAAASPIATRVPSGFKIKKVPKMSKRTEMAKAKEQVESGGIAGISFLQAASPIATRVSSGFKIKKCRKWQKVSKMAKRTENDEKPSGI